VTIICQDLGPGYQHEEIVIHGSLAVPC